MTGTVQIDSIDTTPQEQLGRAASDIFSLDLHRWFRTLEAERVLDQHGGLFAPGQVRELIGQKIADLLPDPVSAHMPEHREPQPLVQIRLALCEDLLRDSPQ